MIGVLKKRGEEWFVATVLYNSAWSNYYPTHPDHNLWLKIWGKDGQKVLFEIVNKTHVKLKELCNEGCDV